MRFERGSSLKGLIGLKRLIGLIGSMSSIGLKNKGWKIISAKSHLTLRLCGLYKYQTKF
jgi:hypothetical protein